MSKGNQAIDEHSKVVLIKILLKYRTIKNNY